MVEVRQRGGGVRPGNGAGLAWEESRVWVILGAWWAKQPLSADEERGSFTARKEKKTYKYREKDDYTFIMRVRWELWSG